MANRLADAISPYLRSHADNPVDWWQWGIEAFAEAERRDVPVMISIGYSSCHWCHVMARESFSDPVVAAFLNENFVAIKVDREEYPEVDASFMAAASAFTPNLGWPLTVFATPDGHSFYAGSYFPPRPTNGLPEFLRVLGAVSDAWAQRREEVLATGAAVAAALADASAAASAGWKQRQLPSLADIERAVERLAALEDPQYGGFGTPPAFAEPKFAVAPALNFLLAQSDFGALLGARTLKIMGASPLRDPIEGGFFRYSTQRDWGEPHYERMLYDNALLLDASTRAWQNAPESSAWASTLSHALAGFLLSVLRLPSGAFASAQDSESVLAGRRSEGGYYSLDEETRATVAAPALDEKVLAGWNGLAIAALSRAGTAFEKPEWIDAARRAADHVIALHLKRADNSDAQQFTPPALTLARASLGGRVSPAPATLEDYGMLAGGLLALAVALGEVRYASIARELIDATLQASQLTRLETLLEGAAHDADNNTANESDAVLPFAVPGGSEAVLAAQGLALELDTAEGAYPSGISALGNAAFDLYLLTGDDSYLQAATSAGAAIGTNAAERPLAYGAILALAARLQQPVVQLVSVVTGDGAHHNWAAGLSEAASPNEQSEAASPEEQSAELLAVGRRHAASLSLHSVLTEPQAAAFADAGFELFAGRTSHNSVATSYLCQHFVCRLPMTDAVALDDALRGRGHEPAG